LPAEIMGGKIVLIVDDDFDVRESIADVLRDEGYVVALAVDGIEALSYLRSNAPPHLILLDWMMPRMDGATFRAEQRKDPALAAVPVVLLTADTRTPDQQLALDARAYLRKPIRLEELLETVDRCLNQS
jgi:CheY-like chemotaxis protein